MIDILYADVLKRTQHFPTEITGKSERYRCQIQHNLKLYTYNNSTLAGLLEQVKTDFNIVAEVQLLAFVEPANVWELLVVQRLHDCVTEKWGDE